MGSAFLFIWEDMAIAYNRDEMFYIKKAAWAAFFILLL